MQLKQWMVLSITGLTIGTISGSAIAGECSCRPPSITFTGPQSTGLITVNSTTGSKVRYCQYFQYLPTETWIANYYALENQSCLQSWSPNLSANSVVKAEGSGTCTYTKMVYPNDASLVGEFSRFKEGLSQYVRKVAPEKLCELKPLEFTFTGPIKTVLAQDHLTNCRYSNQAHGWEAQYYFVGTQECLSTWNVDPSSKTLRTNRPTSCDYKVKGPLDDTLTGSNARFKNENAIYKNRWPCY